MTPEAISTLLQPYIQDIPMPQVEWPHMCGQLSTYLELILKWNARTNLTAIRTPEEIVRRHFGESLFAGRHLGACATLLDFGSGAGFPGVPIQLLRPDLHVTLAESQGKKAAFLREVCRELALPTKVFPGRVEAMSPACQFDVVVLRAVDRMGEAIAEAARRSRHRVVTLTAQFDADPQAILEKFELTKQIAMPNSDNAFLNIFARN